MKRLLLTLAAVVLTSPAFAQSTLYSSSVTGNVGIGTTTPNSLLQAYNGEVQVGSSGLACTAIQGGAIRFNSGSLYYCDGSSTWQHLAGGGSGTVSSGTAGQVAYYQSTGTTVIGTSTMNIVNGNVGIGTLAPTYPLEVIGPTANGNNLYVTDPSTGYMLFQDELANGTPSAAGSPALVLSPGSGSAAGAGAYIDLLGRAEAGVSLVATNNATGQRVMRIINGSNGCTNCFSIQSLDDTQTSINAVPFQIANSAPSDSLFIGSNGSVGFGTTAPQSLVHAFNGEVQVGSSGISCAAANNGAIRYASGALYYCTGTTWTAVGGGGGSFVAPTVQKLALGSGTYTTPTSPRPPLYIRVRMVGGGGGGSGSLGSGSSGGGGNGTASTFGASLLSAGGGFGGDAVSYGALGPAGGAGGTSSLGAGPVGLALTGSGGGGDGLSITGGIAGAGGQGGSSAFGGAGIGPGVVVAGGAGAANTGGGGSGGGGIGPGNSGCGGGSGGFVDAIITSPAATYAYSVGVGGGAGSAGPSGVVGGAGGSGVIIVEEYYQ